MFGAFFVPAGIPKLSLETSSPKNSGADGFQEGFPVVHGQRGTGLPVRGKITGRTCLWTHGEKRSLNRIRHSVSNRCDNGQRGVMSGWKSGREKMSNITIQTRFQHEDQDLHDDTPIYRYFSAATFKKFINSSSLIFQPITNWSDKHEGLRFKFFQEALIKDIERHRKPSAFLGSCWTLQNEECCLYGGNHDLMRAGAKELKVFGSASMWDSYCNRGGARIKTTLGKVKRLFFKSELPDGEIRAGSILYEPQSKWQTLPGETGLHGQLFIKGVTFRHESEYRFIFLPAQNQSSGIQLPIHNLYCFIDEILVAPEVADKPWGAEIFYRCCVNHFLDTSRNTNQKNERMFCRISQMYGNISQEVGTCDPDQLPFDVKQNG
jgi:hypothetical protein